MDWVTYDANILPDSLISNAFKPQRLFRGPSAHPGEGNDRAAGKDRSQVKLNFIHEALIQSLAEYFATALHEHAGNLFLAKLAQKGRQIFWAVNDRPRRESIRKKAGVPGQHARARENNAPRLLRTAHPRGETRIIGPRCFCADQNGVDCGAQLLGVATGSGTGDPRFLAGRRR
jgi:hypothetical protein